MPKPLKNVKHENFARELVANKGKQAEAYRKVYDPKANGSADRCATRLLSTNVHIRDRVIQIMDEQGLTLPELTRELKTCVMDEDNTVKLKAVQTAYKLKGCIDQGQRADTINNTYAPTQINIVIAPPVSQLDGERTTIEAETDKDVKK